MSFSNGKNIQLNDIESEAKTEKWSFEDALNLTKYGKFHVMITLVSGLSLMSAVLENISVSLVMPYVKCGLQLTTNEQGLLMSMSFLGICVSSHLWGFLADTTGRQRIIRISSILGFICSFLSAFSFNTYMMLILRFFVGFFVSGSQASAFSYVSEFHTKATVQRAASFTSSFISLVLVYLPLLAIIFIPMNWSFYISSTLEFTPWRLYMIVASGVNFVVFWIFCFVPESPRFLMQINEREKALDVLRLMYAFNTRNSKESFPVKEILAEPTGRSVASVKGFSDIVRLVWAQTKPIFVPPFWDKTLRLSFIVFVLFAIGHGLFAWIPGFLLEMQNNVDSGKTLCQIVGHQTVSTDCNIDNQNISTYQIILGVGVFFSVLQTIVSHYMDKLGPKTVTAFWLTISSTCSVGIVFLTEYYLVVAAIIVFVSCAANAAIICAISVDLFTTNIRAMATCCIYMFGRLGGFAGSNLVGLMLENHCTSIFYIYAALLVICIFVFISMRPKPN